MCFNISNTRRMAEIEARFGAALEGDASRWVPVTEVSGFNRPDWPLLCSDNPSSLRWARWGLVPSWVEEESRAADLALKTLNARAESLREKPSFRDSADKRCLVPVTGFFEPHHRGKEVIPYLFSHREGEIFTLGGIFQDSPFSGSPDHRSFSIVTVDADRETARIHNRKKRMPLFVAPEDWEDWLSGDKEWEIWKRINQSARPLRYWPVSRELYRKKRSLQGEDLLNEVKIPRENLDKQGELF